MSNRPPIDRHAAAGRADGQVAHDVVGQQAATARLFFRVITLPFWLPFYLVGIVRQRRAMTMFARVRSKGRLADDALGREIALAWVAQHPERYPHGQYDRRFNKMERRFARIIQQHREDIR